MVEYKNINITNLLLNPINPRHNAVEHQIESIYAMVKDQEEKLVVLARHIVENGLNPTEFILVKFDNNQWIVREGNRRITVLKLLNEPSLTPPEFPKIKKEFQKLSKTFNKALLQNIPCVVLDNESEINEWVRLKHTGQNEGAGTVGWNGQQTSRFRAYIEGKHDMRTLFLDYLLNYSELPEYLRSKLYTIKKTNFDRLMGDPDVRALLGLKVEGNTLALVDGINRFLLMVLYDLVNDLKVGRIYDKEDRMSYIQELKERALREDAAQQTTSSTDETEDEDSGNEATFDDTSDEATNDESDNEMTGNDVSDNGVLDDDSADTDNFSDKDDGLNSLPSKPKKGRSYPINRNTIVANVHKLVIKQPRILKIYNELKTLSLQDYSNACAVLFRTFIELSADHYLEQKSLMKGKLSVDSSLGNKIDAIAGYMQDNGLMTEHQLRPIRQMTSSPTQNQSIKTFHAYVHNKNVTPTVTDLKTAWDDLWPFIEMMWS